jgi:hypothetical protein
MARSLIVLAVLSLSALPSPASAQTHGKGGGIASLYDPSERPRMLRAAALTRARLARPVNFDGIANPKTSLGDALDLLQKRSGIPLDINIQAFKDEGVEDALSLPIGRRIPPLRGVPASTVLSIMLCRTPSRSGVTFYPRASAVEISTVRAYLYESRRDGGIVSPTPAALPTRTDEKIP